MGDIECKQYHTESQKKKESFEKDKEKEFFSDLYRELSHFDSKSVVNLGIKQRTARKYPLVSFRILITDDFPCVMAHSSGDDKKVIIKAGRKDDKLCTVLCRECVNELCFALRTVNEKNIYHSNKNGLSVTYHKNFSKGSFCYFCGCDDDACYDITLNKIRFQICPRCREKSIINLKRLILRIK